jgi:hypothetical protein
MVSIPEPTSMAKNLVQTADTWKKWQAQATDAKAVADARLLAEANLLVIAMNDFTEGYRRLSGEFQDFRPSWETERRRKAEVSFREWVDPRDITTAIDARLGLLSEMQSERAALEPLIRDAWDFIDHTVRLLIDGKRDPAPRARLIDALATARTVEQARVVRDWALHIRQVLDDGEQYLRSANLEVAKLTAHRTELNRFTELPTDKKPWYTKLRFR